MEDKVWDDQFRDLLGDHTPAAEHPFAQTNHDLKPGTQLPDHKDLSPSEADLQAKGWKRIEASLNAVDQAFDEHIRQRLHQHYPKYDPNSWPAFLKRFTDSRFLRAKLIVLKSIEVVALLLLLLTAVNMGRLGKLPFTGNLFEPNVNSSKQDQQVKPEATTPFIKAPSPKAETRKDQNYTEADGISIPDAVVSSGHESKSKGRQIANSIAQLNPYAIIAVEGSKIVLPISEATDDSAANLNTPLNHDASTQPLMIASEIPEPIVAASGIPNLSASPTLPNLNSAIPLNLESNVPGPKFIKAINHTFTEFAVLVQSDYNGLRMPEDRLYSIGRQIIFPSKGIMSPGYGGGFTIALGHPLWALETGVIYSSKAFKPGRQLVIGGAFDNGSVEFKDMRLQIVSLPVQYRYRFDHKGRFKSYALAGFGFNVIAQSDIDVITKYHFASLSFGEDPNNDPNLYPTIQETKRISEHIRDGAPFSTKSFVTANAGLGIEYAIYGHKSLFLQSAIQYQIPNIEFSNNNGKHLRSISIQAGVRGPLGK